MPRYELREGKAEKFWAIERDANYKAFTVTWGKLGTKGQSKKHKFAQPHLCSAAYAKLVEDKLGKGYRIAGSGTSVAAKRNAALEAAIDEAPADRERWLVYSDWLQQEGDARGELIALRAAKQTAKANKYAAAHADALWGAARYLCTDKPFAGRMWEGWGSDGPVEYETLREQHELSPLGFVTSATFTGLDEDGHMASAVGDLLAAPVGRFVQELHFELDESFEGVTGQPNYTLVAKAIAHAKPSALRVLTMDYGGYQRSWTYTGDLGPVLAATPHLERLDLAMGNITLGKHLELPALKVLRLVTGGLDAANVRAIAAAEWPALEELVIYFGTKRYGATATLKDVRALLAAKFPKLRRLALCNSEDLQTQIAEAALGSKLATQLEHLDLSRGTMTDEAIGMVNGRTFKHLTLDVTDNYFSPAGEKQLRAHWGKRIETSQQRYGEMIDERDRYGKEEWAIKGKYTFRYAAVGE